MSIGSCIFVKDMMALEDVELRIRAGEEMSSYSKACRSNAAIQSMIFSYFWWSKESIAVKDDLCSACQGDAWADRDE